MDTIMQVRTMLSNKGIITNWSSNYGQPTAGQLRYIETAVWDAVGMREVLLRTCVP